MKKDWNNAIKKLKDKLPKERMMLVTPKDVWKKMRKELKKKGSMLNK